MSQEMRIGDDDRDRVVATLQTAFGEGRLDQIELDERLGKVFTAKTTGELIPLTSDLPVRAPAGAPAPSATASFMKDNSALWVPPLGTCLLVTLIYAITNLGGYFWPVWVYLGMGVVASSALYAKWKNTN